MKKLKIERYIIILLGCIFLIRCTANESEQKKKKIDFNVDSTLISDQRYELDSLNIKFRSPRNWESLSSDKDLGLILNKQISAQSFTLGFINKVDSSILIVNNFNSVRDSIWNQMISNPAVLFNANKQWMNIQQSEFQHNSLSINQLFLQNRSFVNMKLIGETPDKKRFAFDFFLKRSALKSHMKSMESSIGTIKLINREQ